MILFMKRRKEMTEFSDGSYLLDDSDMYPVFDAEGRQVITIFDDLDSKIMNEYLEMKKLANWRTNFILLLFFVYSKRF